MWMTRGNKKSVSDYRKPSKSRSSQTPVRTQETFTLKCKRYNEKVDFFFLLIDVKMESPLSYFLIWSKYDLVNPEQTTQTQKSLLDKTVFAKREN